MVLCKKIAHKIKIPYGDVDSVQYLFLSIFPTHLKQYLNDPPDPLKNCIFCIDLHSVKVLVSYDEMLSSPYLQGGICFLDENNPSYL